MDTQNSPSERERDTDIKITWSGVSTDNVPVAGPDGRLRPSAHQGAGAGGSCFFQGPSDPSKSAFRQYNSDTGQFEFRPSAGHTSAAVDSAVRLEGAGAGGSCFFQGPSDPSKSAFRQYNSDTGQFEFRPSAGHTSAAVDSAVRLEGAGAGGSCFFQGPPDPSKSAFRQYNSDTGQFEFRPSAGHTSAAVDSAVRLEGAGAGGSCFFQGPSESSKSAFRQYNSDTGQFEFRPSAGHTSAAVDSAVRLEGAGAGGSCFFQGPSDPSKSAFRQYNSDTGQFEFRPSAGHTSAAVDSAVRLEGAGAGGSCFFQGPSDPSKSAFRQYNSDTGQFEFRPSAGHTSAAVDSAVRLEGAGAGGSCFFQGPSDPSKSAFRQYNSDTGQFEFRPSAGHTSAAVDSAVRLEGAGAGGSCFFQGPSDPSKSAFRQYNSDTGQFEFRPSAGHTSAAVDSAVRLEGAGAGGSCFFQGPSDPSKSAFRQYNSDTGQFEFRPSAGHTSAAVDSAVRLEGAGAGGSCFFQGPSDPSKSAFRQYNSDTGQFEFRPSAGHTSAAVDSAVRLEGAGAGGSCFFQGPSDPSKSAFRQYNSDTGQFEFRPSAGHTSAAVDSAVRLEGAGAGGSCFFQGPSDPSKSAFRQYNSDTGQFEFRPSAGHTSAAVDSAAASPYWDGRLWYRGPDGRAVPVAELMEALSGLGKECETLWAAAKDLQGQFMNDLSSLQQVQSTSLLAGLNYETGWRLKMQQLQQRTAIVYRNMCLERHKLIEKLNEGVQQIALAQNDLISVQLLDWKRRQKLAQIGAPFEYREEHLDAIQAQFEALAEQNWELRKVGTWLADLLRRGPKLPDNSALTAEAHLKPIIENLTRLLIMLVTQSFIVSEQPDPVIKTNHKFTAEVRLLIGEKLGIKQQVETSNVTVKIIGEEQARQLESNALKDRDITSGVGNISNDFEKLGVDEKGRMTAKLSNSKLTKIAPRKAKQGGEGKGAGLSSATDQKYALLFSISSFQLANLGFFEVWTLSLPIMVTVHGCQDCDAQANILWQRAFGDVNWVPGATATDVQVAWPQLADVLRFKFKQYTGISRNLTDDDLRHLAEKIYHPLPYNENSPKISFQRFAKAPLRDRDQELPFSFWEWIFSVMTLIKSKLTEFWNEGWLMGFVSKAEASAALRGCSEPRFLLRFSDSTQGAISIGFVCQDEKDGLVPLHLRPFSAKDLDQLPLPQRIAKCPQLQEIRYLYPNIPKEEVLRKLETEERNKSPSPTQDGYIAGEIIMVVPKKGGSGLDSNAASPGQAGNPFSPRPESNSNFPPQAGMETAGEADLNAALSAVAAAATMEDIGALVGDEEAMHTLQNRVHMAKVYGGHYAELLGQGAPAAAGFMGLQGHFDPALLDSMSNLGNFHHHPAGAPRNGEGNEEMDMNEGEEDYGH